MKVDVIIGSGYGDEGKGLATDYFTAHSTVGLGNVCVVRFNGSAQAGHTVDVGKSRHVFSHFGSGSYAGASTYLAHPFVVHPMLFRKEYEAIELLKFGKRPAPKIDEVMVSSKCYVTTPWDMIINQHIENNRANNRHGSCGIGFGETIERSDVHFHLLTVGDLLNSDKDIFRKNLIDIRRNYLKNRCRELNTKLSSEEETLYFSDNILENFIKDCEFFISNTKVAPIYTLTSFLHLIFEGAQGLMLDQDYGIFPHVTRSNTGLKNVMTILDSFNFLDLVNRIDVRYITRTYTTRHGAGYLPFEFKLPCTKLYPGIEDKTNIDGPWQGGLRFTYLNLDEIRKAIQYDINNYADSRVKVSGVMTCCDQVEGQQILGIKNNHVVDFGKNETGLYNLIREFGLIVGGNQVYTSFGPTKTNMGLFTF